MGGVDDIACAHGVYGVAYVGVAVVMNMRGVVGGGGAVDVVIGGCV